MESQVVIAVVSGGVGIILAALAFLFKSVTGENRANVRKTYTEAITNDAGASNSYMEAARKAAEMMAKLQEQVTALSERVDTLEREKDELQEEVSKLREENKKLRDMLGTKEDK